MRKVFIVTASGPEAFGHYQDTIKRKRSLSEIKNFLSEREINTINSLYHGKDYSIWGALPGSGNINTWTKMDRGDYIIFYQQGKFKLLGEVAYKIHNKDVANYFWGTDKKGQTWEYTYFIINDREIDVPLGKFNQYLKYKSNFTPQGFGAVHSERQKEFERTYGDFYGLMMKINAGKVDDIQKLSEVVTGQKVIVPEEKPKREPTEHDEIQWRLIRLGKAAGNDVWIPKNDQKKSTVAPNSETSL